MTHSRALFMKGRPHTALRLAGSRSPRKLLFSLRAINTAPPPGHAISPSSRSEMKGECAKPGRLEVGVQGCKWVGSRALVTPSSPSLNLASDYSLLPLRKEKSHRQTSPSVLCWVPGLGFPESPPVMHMSGCTACLYYKTAWYYSCIAAPTLQDHSQVSGKGLEI